MRRFFVTAVGLLVVGGCTSDRRVEDAPVPREEPVAASAAPAPVPEARTEVGAARLGDAEILVVGGFRGDGSTTDRADRYEVDADRWSAAPSLPRPLHHPGVASFRGRVFVAGGYTPDASGGWAETAEVWSLGPGDDAWRPEPPLPDRRGALGLVGTSSHLVAFGGTSGGAVVASVLLLPANGPAWSAGPPMRQPREHTAAAARASDGRVFAIAGRVGGLDTNLISVESFDPARPAEGWRAEPSLLRSRGGIGAAAVGDAVCVAGGEEPAGTIASVECLDGGAWREVGQLASPRHGLGVVAADGRRLHALAGGPQPGLFVSDTHEVLTIP